MTSARLNIGLCMIQIRSGLVKVALEVIVSILVGHLPVVSVLSLTRNMSVAPVTEVEYVIKLMMLKTFALQLAAVPETTAAAAWPTHHTLSIRSRPIDNRIRARPIDNRIRARPIG